MKAASNDEAKRAALIASLPELKQRARAIGQALRFAIISGVCSACLVLVSFLTAIVGVNHAYGALLLFTAAMAAFSVSFVFLWLELRIALKELQAQN